MKKLYLHIGAHKTGTSALQHFFLKNRALLDHYGVYYPFTGCNSKGGHNRFFLPLNKNKIKKREEIGHKINKLKSFNSFVSDLKSEINHKDCILMSSESISTIIDHNLFEAQKLLELFDIVKIIYYVRRQDEAIESVYRYEVKVHSTDSLECFTIKEKWRNYYRVCINSAKLVGKENVIVRVYEKDRFTGGNIFQDFLSCIGISFNEEFELPSHDINISLRPDELYFKRAYNSLSVKFEQKLKVAELLENFSLIRTDNRDKKRLLSPQQRLEIIKRFDKQNMRLASEFLGRKNGILFSDPLPDINEKWQPYLGLKQEEIKPIVNYFFNNSSNYINLFLIPCVKGLFASDKYTRANAAMLRFIIYRFFHSLRLLKNK